MAISPAKAKFYQVVLRLLVGLANGWRDFIKNEHGVDPN
jgi:hypothetical protein